MAIDLSCTIKIPDTHARLPEKAAFFYMGIMMTRANIQPFEKTALGIGSAGAFGRHRKPGTPTEASGGNAQKIL